MIIFVCALIFIPQGRDGVDGTPGFNGDQVNSRKHVAIRMRALTHTCLPSWFIATGYVLYLLATWIQPKFVFALISRNGTHLSLC